MARDLLQRASRERALALFVALVALVALGCSSTEPPVSDAIRRLSDRRPLVLVPGVTGAALREIASGRVIWGRGRDLLRPRDGGYAVARPLSTDETGESGAEAFAVIEEIRVLGLIRRDVYRPIVDLMEANGYRRGELGAPTPEADFYLFAFDWRDDLVASAGRLTKLLEGVRRARAEPTLEVDLICQSAGGQICRYLAKYGDASLEEVERGGRGPSPSVRVAKAILIGTANGGSARIVRELHRGRTYVPGVGRRMHPEVLFSFASLFQDLPVYRDDLFVDADGRPMAIDIFDPAVWREHGLSIFAEDSRERIARNGRTDLFGDEALRAAALERFLDRGRRLHAVLERDVDGFSSRYYSIQNVEDETPDRIVLLRRDDGGSELLFSGDKRLRRRAALHAAVTAGGDGHATEASQNWLSPQELGALAAEPLHLDGDHFKMILDPAAQSRILEYLED